MMLDDIPLALRVYFILQYDGASAHKAHLFFVTILIYSFLIDG
jgi:hypothetical protein